MLIALYLLRHGRTELNKRHMFRGDTDPDLAPEGFRDANEAAFYLRSIDLSFIVSSDKKRAKTTADIVSLQKKLDPELSKYDLTPAPNNLLRPWNIGDFGGLEKTPERRAELEYYVDNPDVPVPGGTSLSSFRNRIRPLLIEGVEYGITYGVPGLIVVHSSVIHEAGEVFGGHHEAGHVKPGGVAAVSIGENGKLNIKPIFKKDELATSQNVLGTNIGRSGLNS